MSYPITLAGGWSRRLAALLLSLAACGDLACGGPAPSAVQLPCAYRDSDPIYCVCWRLCPGEQCVLHAGRCGTDEPGTCPFSTGEVRTSTVVASISFGEACGDEP